LGAADADPTDWTSPVQAMQPGQIHPPEKDAGVSQPLPSVGDELAAGWYSDTEFGDIRGAHWCLGQRPQHPRWRDPQAPAAMESRFLAAE
jgi:hypothetical protein